MIQPNDIPPEIWLEIVETVRDLEAFADASESHSYTFRSPRVDAFSFVSHYFRNIALRIIFDELAWHIGSGPAGQDAEEEGPPKSQENSRLCGRLLIERPDLRPMVHTLRVYGEGTQKGINDLHDLPVLRVIEQTIPLLLDLHSLKFTDFPITFPLYQTFHALPNLSQLALSDCSFWRDDVPAMVAHTEPLRVRDLRAEFLPQAGDQEELRRIYSKLIFNSAVKNLALNYVTTPVIGEQLGSASNPTLLIESLRLLIRWPQEDSNAVVNLLRHCPEVRDLSVTLQRVDRAIPIPLPQEFIPNLSIYRGSFGCAEEFITGRPVHSIYINTALQPRSHVSGFPRVDTGAELKILAAGVVPVRHLRFGVLTWRAALVSTVADLFPELETLRIDDRSPMIWEDWKADDGTKAIRRLTKLKTATITVCRRMKHDVERQRTIIQAWSEVNPTLHIVWLTRWQRWTKCEEGDWQLATKAMSGETVVQESGLLEGRN